MALRPTSPDTQALRDAYAAGRGIHPRMDLGFEAFARGVDGSRPPKHPGDFFLARACDGGVPGAWERLQVRYRGPLLAFLRGRGAASGEAHQLLDDAWGSLAEPPPQGAAATRIGTYDGRGTLYSWLATVLWRRLADRWRRTSKDAPAQDESAAPRERSDPARKAAHEETAERLGEALEDAWSDLTERELQAVVLKYVYGLPQTRIAKTLNVGAPRVTRILQGATRRLRAAIESRFESHPDWSDTGSGWGSLAGAVERMLARTAASLETAERITDGG